MRTIRQGGPELGQLVSHARPRLVRRAKAISHLAPSAAAGRSRWRPTRDGTSRCTAERHCSRGAALFRPSDRSRDQFCRRRRRSGRISCIDHAASSSGAAENGCRLANARGCAAPRGGRAFEFPRPDGRRRGAPRKARAAANPNRPFSAGQFRSHAASGFGPACRATVAASRSRSASRYRAVAAVSASRISAAAPTPRQATTS